MFKRYNLMKVELYIYIYTFYVYIPVEHTSSCWFVKQLAVSFVDQQYQL